MLDSKELWVREMVDGERICAAEGRREMGALQERKEGQDGMYVDSLCKWRRREWKAWACWDSRSGKRTQMRHLNGVMQHVKDQYLVCVDGPWHSGQDLLAFSMIHT